MASTWRTATSQGCISNWSTLGRLESFFSPRNLESSGSSGEWSPGFPIIHGSWLMLIRLLKNGMSGVQVHPASGLLLSWVAHLQNYVIMPVPVLFLPMVQGFRLQQLKARTLNAKSGLWNQVASKRRDFKKSGRVQVWN